MPPLLTYKKFKDIRYIFAAAFVEQPFKNIIKK